MFLSSLEQGSVSLYVLFCLPVVSGLPLHVGSSSGAASPSSWLGGLWWCGAEAEERRSSWTHCLCLEALCAFAVCFSAVLLAAWCRDAQGDASCLAGRPSKASLLLPLSGAAGHSQAALTSLVGNRLVK